MEKTIYTGNVKTLRKRAGRYTLSIAILELNNCIINMDVHDSIVETLGHSKLCTALIKKIYDNIPEEIKLIKSNNYWEIINEDKILSDAICRAM